jgi:hypothetical protein
MLNVEYPSNRDRQAPNAPRHAGVISSRAGSRNGKRILTFINREAILCHSATPEVAMPHDVISTCPVCSKELAVTRLHCRSCGTTLEGDFSVGRFGRLSRDQVALLESFLRSRGNLRDMERELGISYPTVRSRVEALVRALGFGARGDDGSEEPASEAAPPAPSRREILEQLARHEISADEAAAAIRALGRSR